MKKHSDVVTLTAGQSSFTVDFFNMRKRPRAARGDILKPGAAGDNIFVSSDYTSYSPQGAAFYFSAPIPDDGLIYQLFFEFFL